jgi:hypothetical protein
MLMIGIPVQAANVSASSSYPVLLNDEQVLSNTMPVWQNTEVYI